MERRSRVEGAGAALAAVLGIGLFVGLATRSTEATVGPITWIRTIDVGAVQEVTRQVNCDRVPFNRPKRKIPDSKKAGSLRDADRGNLCEYSEDGSNADRARVRPPGGA